jgi:hypothetical protein
MQDSWLYPHKASKYFESTKEGAMEEVNNGKIGGVKEGEIPATKGIYQEGVYQGHNLEEQFLRDSQPTRDSEISSNIYVDQ